MSRDVMKQALEVLSLELPIGSHIELKNALRAAIEQAQEPVACPFPCGWKRLFEIIVAEGAFLARSLEEDEAITAHQRQVVMRLIGYAKDMALHGMKAAHGTKENT